jgi:hypothetical protein
MTLNKIDLVLTYKLSNKLTNMKQALGQFMTTNQEHILQNLFIPPNVNNIIEPFAGKGDLIKFIPEQDNRAIEMFDIDPQTPETIRRDTIKTPPVYSNKFVLTNPPYLARNKSQDKCLFDKYNENDLYKCFLSELLTENCPIGGIIIIPLNFWSSIRNADIQLRKRFLERFEITHLNIFEEQVFDDTTTTVCSFQFTRRMATTGNMPMPITIFPTQLQLFVSLSEENNYTIGGEIYNLNVNKSYTITRITRKKYTTNGLTNILVKCIDDNADNTIQLSIADVYVDETPNQSARTYATLVIQPPISKKRQEQLVADFNHLLNAYREKYHSLFLTNYRESKDIARKRISFDLVYQIVGHLLI